MACGGQPNLDQSQGGKAITFMSEFKDYLGDSVYADFDGFHVVLTTENGYGPSNTIALEPNVLKALDIYLKRLKEARVMNAP